MALPFADNSFDHVYVIEAACHAPDKVGYVYIVTFSMLLLSLGEMFR